MTANPATPVSGEDEVERVAKALADADNRPPLFWERATEYSRDKYRGFARAAIAALATGTAGQGESGEAK